MSAAAASPPAVPATAGAHKVLRRPSTLTIWRWELRKLISQKRTYLGLGIVVVFPLLFVIAQQLRHHPGHGGGSIFFSEITQSWLAPPVPTTSPPRTATARPRRSSRAPSTAARCSPRRRSPPSHTRPSPCSSRPSPPPSWGSPSGASITSS